MLRQVNLAVWAGLSLAIFLCLLFVSNIASTREIKNVSVQQAYDDLALALDSASILPGVGQGEMLSALAAQTLDKSKLNPPFHRSSLSIDISLGSVITANFGDAGARFVVLKPEDYKQLKPGALRDALRKISRLQYSTQLKQLVGSASPAVRSFTVSVRPNNLSYVISPGFNGQQCNSVVINIP